MSSFPMVDSQLQETAPFAMGVQSDSEGLAEYSLALAAAGTLDTTFDGDGKVTTTIGSQPYDTAFSLAVQPDGKIVVAGSSWSDTSFDYDFALARYNPDGSLDATFDVDGTLTTAIGPSTDSAYSLALQPDGKIVVAGSRDNSPTYLAIELGFALVRYNPDGSLDTTFDGDGIVTTAVGAVTYDVASSLALQPDGKILAAGTANSDFALVRYNPDGSLDTTFDGDGKVTTGIGSRNDGASSLALQPDGKIVVAGTSGAFSASFFALARYNLDGSLDTTFDGDGIVTTAVAAIYSSATSLALQPDGKIVVAGSSFNGFNSTFALARYNPDGSLDTTFDGDGKVTTAIGTTNDVAHSLALQPDGKIVVAGSSLNGTKLDFALARYNPDGSLDTTFDGDGKMTVAIGVGDDEAFGVAIQNDGAIVAAGRSASDFALIRVLGDRPFDLVGGPGDDSLNGSNGNDTLIGLGGNDTIDGGSGTDSAAYNSYRDANTITKTVSGITVSGPEGNDTLTGIERLQFSDRKLAFDLGSGEAAGNTVSIMGAAFDGPTIQQRPDYVAIGLQFFDTGMSMREVCELVAPILGLGNADFVESVYTNVVAAPPSILEQEYFLGLLQDTAQPLTQGQLLEIAVNAPLNEVNINLVGLQASGVEFV